MSRFCMVLLPGLSPVAASLCFHLFAFQRGGHGVPALHKLNLICLQICLRILISGSKSSDMSICFWLCLFACCPCYAMSILSCTLSQCLQAFVKHWRQGKLSAEKETVGEVQVRSFLIVYSRPPVRSSGTVSSKEFLLNSDML